MADKKDGSAKGNPNDTGGSGKKPKPLLDLKATEVRGSPPAAKTTANHLKGAPSATDKPSPSTSKPSTGTASTGTSSNSSGASGSKPSSPSAGQPVGASASMSGAGTAGKPDAKASTSGPTTRSTAGAGSDKTAPQGSSGSNAGSATPPPPASPPPQKSGGGFFSTLSHMVAAIIGGGIALFGAEPISKELGIQLNQPAGISKEVSDRLAALEAKSSAGGGQATGLQDDVSKLNSQLASTRERVSKLETLGKEVADLSAEFKKIETAQSAPAAGAPTTGSGQTNTAAASNLQTRLSKLESAFSSLSSATTSDGKPSSTAQVATFSAKLADLESSVNTQLASMRKSLTSDFDTRLSSTSSTTAKAVAGAERLDREVSDIKNDTARLEQRSKVLKSASDKLTASLRAVSDQAAELKVELDTLKGDVKQELAKVARPDDVKQAIAPVTTKVAAIEKNLSAVLANESARKQNAERIVLSLELSNLKRVLERGAPYASELSDVQRIAGSSIDFASLDAYTTEGVPTGQELTRQFRDVAYKIINAEEAPKDDASRIDRLFAAAKSIVQVRRTDLPAKEKTAEAAVAKIEKHLKSGDLSGALSVAETLSDKLKKPAGEWLRKLAARAKVDQAITKIEEQLKASLGGGSAPAGKPVDKKG